MALELDGAAETAEAEKARVISPEVKPFILVTLSDDVLILIVS
jgi:hypothetical protein